MFVDKNRTGEIDIGEWQEFLKGMNQPMSGTDSRRLFVHIDEDHNGVLSIEEISKVVFNRASAHQLKVMVHVISSELNYQEQKDKEKAETEISRNDLRQLYGIYDEEHKVSTFFVAAWRVWYRFLRVDFL